MPRGKYSRKNKHKENALITRLMQISLKMDDHIYNGKHITTSQAGRFLQEISTLKLQCLPTNVRALQVIEKLTRCMTSIICEEDTGHGGYSFNTSVINTQYAGSNSPVYSLPDEDRALDINENDDEILNCPDYETVQKQINLSHISHELFVTNSSKDDGVIITPLEAQNKPKNNLGDDKIIDITNENDDEVLNCPDDEIVQEQNNLSHTSHELFVNSSKEDGVIITPLQAQNKTKNNLDDDKIIDITNDSDTDETSNIVSITNEQNCIRHIDSGISKMTIEDELCRTSTDDVICSQSILDKNDNDKANNVVDKEKGNVLLVEEEVQHKIDAKAHVTNKVHNYLNTHTPLTDTTTQASAIAPSNLVNSQTTYANSELVNAVKLTEKKIKRRAKKTTNLKENDNATKNKTKSTNVLSNCSYQNTMIAKEVAYTNSNGTSSKAVKKPRKKLKNKPEIYNNNVENDLSWVESLRYVREISPEENDPALSLLEDNFWDNFALPDKWNDSEFD